MSKFDGSFSENKLRIPLTGFAAQTIENDCYNFSKKKTTLINNIIINYYQRAECSISLRLQDYKKELLNIFESKSPDNKLIDKILTGKELELRKKYNKRIKSDENWQITLNQKVIDLLTLDPYTREEIYYSNKPGRYIQSIIEEYSRQPYYIREEIVFKEHIDNISDAICKKNIIIIDNINNKRLYVKPYGLMSDPLSMYHYLVGYVESYDNEDFNTTNTNNTKTISIRLSRIKKSEIHYESGELSEKEKVQIRQDTQNKGVQFLSSENSNIKIWLSDNGIKKYSTQLHLRPIGTVDSYDNHIYHFNCTETQILYYFVSFGKDAKILSPQTLNSKFRTIYEEAYNQYTM